MSLNELRGTIQADELLFWGKITGINADYYIAVAVTYNVVVSDQPQIAVMLKGAVGTANTIGYVILAGKT